MRATLAKGNLSSENLIFKGFYSADPLDGSWAGWSECSQSCGGGTQTREGGGDEDDSEQRQCNIEPCPITTYGKQHLDITLLL